MFVYIQQTNFLPWLSLVSPAYISNDLLFNSICSNEILVSKLDNPDFPTTQTYFHNIAKIYFNTILRQCLIQRGFWAECRKGTREGPEMFKRDNVEKQKL